MERTKQPFFSLRYSLDTCHFSHSSITSLFFTPFFSVQVLFFVTRVHLFIILSFLTVRYIYEALFMQFVPSFSYLGSIFLAGVSFMTDDWLLLLRSSLLFYVSFFHSYQLLLFSLLHYFSTLLLGSNRR